MRFTRGGIGVPQRGGGSSMMGGIKAEYASIQILLVEKDSTNNAYKL